MVVNDYTALLSGTSINGSEGQPVFYSYSFPGEVPLYLQGAYPAEALATFQTFSRAERAMAEAALEAFASVSGLQFLEAKPGEGDINFLKFDLIAFAGYAPGGAFAHGPDDAAGYRSGLASDVFFNVHYGALNWGNLVHEIGHALGLKHPSEGEVTLAPALDTKLHTVMSYQGGFGSPPYAAAGHLDVDAVQFLYGENAQDGSQVTSWSWNASAKRLTIDGGTGNDTIAGIGGSNTIHGHDGNDFISAGYGSSLLYGGNGNDTLWGQGLTNFFGEEGDDVIKAITTIPAASQFMDVWSGNPGNSVLDNQISSRGNLENLYSADTISGGPGNDVIEVNSLFNAIDGGAGDDIIRIMISQIDSDIFADGSSGHDRIEISPWSRQTQYYDLPVRISDASAYLVNFEEISINGSDVNDYVSLTGFSYSDSEIWGWNGTDFLKGGDGIDTMHGGPGNDLLDGGPGLDHIFGDEGSDVIFESSGNDIVDGGPGNDLMLFFGDFADYQIQRHADGHLTVTRPSVSIQTLTSVEILQFNDGDYTWSSQEGEFVYYNNSGPVSAGSLTVSLNEDATKDISASFTDPDSDDLSYEVTEAAHGAVIQIANGVFRYYPDRNYNGLDQFTVTAIDPFQQSATQTVNITVNAVDDLPVTVISPDTPLYSNGQVLSAVAGRPKEITVWVQEVDGEAVSFAASAPTRGTLSGGANGRFTYVAQSGYVGSDGFNVTVTDAHGGSISHQVTLNVEEPGFRMYMTRGFTGSIGGSGTVFGTNSAEEFFALPNIQKITFDPSFARGNDVIHLPGTASIYNVFREESSLVLKFGAAEYRLPVGPDGIPIHFDDGARIARYDEVTEQILLGSQIVEPSVQRQLLAGPQTVQPATIDSQGATAKLFLQNGAEVTLDGDYRVFGTNGLERINWLSGDIVLDPSFARGGDLLTFDQAASGFTARLSGANVILQSTGGSLTIPVGEAGTTLDFPGADDRTLLFNGANVLIGDQAIGTNASALAAFG